MLKVSECERKEALREYQFITESRKWAKGESEHYEARAQFDFIAGSLNELSFKQNDLLRVAPKGLNEEFDS